MKLDFKKMPPEARVWIYQSTRSISDTEESQIRHRIADFVEQWSAHQQPLAAWGDIMHNRFIILMVDGRFNAPSGCSIDESVAFVRTLETDFGLELFDRMTFSYQADGEVYTVPSARFAELYRSGKIDDETMVFDNLVVSKKELGNGWLKPLAKSWHHRFV